MRSYCVIFVDMAHAEIMHYVSVLGSVRSPSVPQHIETFTSGLIEDGGGVGPRVQVFVYFMIPKCGIRLALRLDFFVLAGFSHCLVLPFLVWCGVVCRTEAMDEAAKNGHLDVVTWLHEHRQEGCTGGAMDMAGRHGHLDVSEASTVLLPLLFFSVLLLLLLLLLILLVCEWPFSYSAATGRHHGVGWLGGARSRLVLICSLWKAFWLVWHLYSTPSCTLMRRYVLGSAHLSSTGCSSFSESPPGFPSADPTCCEVQLL